MKCNIFFFFDVAWELGKNPSAFNMESSFLRSVETVGSLNLILAVISLNLIPNIAPKISPRSKAGNSSNRKITGSTRTFFLI